MEKLSSQQYRACVKVAIAAMVEHSTEEKMREFGSLALANRYPELVGENLKAVLDHAVAHSLAKIQEERK